MIPTLLVLAVGAAALYWVSVWWNPSRPCHRCNGGGAHRSGRVFTWSRGACRSCSGSGVHPRAGTKLRSRKR